MTTTLAPPSLPPCVDCGWHPGYELRATAPGRREKLWPTVGGLAVKWMQGMLICAEGDWFGKPLRLREDQQAFTYRWYEFCGGCGYWHYDQAVRGAATGDGKTTFFAGLEDLEMFGPPQIAPVSPNIINAAASFEQADLLFSIAGTMVGGRDQSVPQAPLCGYAEVYDTEIRYADGRPGLMKRVAAVAGTNEGGLPSLFVCDELHEWGDVGSTKARVHMVIGKSTAKRRMICRMPDGSEVTRGAGRNLNISTAGFDVDHSLLGAMYKHGKAAMKDPSLAPRLLFDWREARPGLDFDSADDRRLAVQDASAAAGVLWDVEKRVREYGKPEVESHEWIRYYANAWVDVPADSWLKDHPAAWGKCQGSWELEGGEPAVLGLDLSISRDSTAVVEVARLADGRIAAVAKIWKPAGRLIPHKDVSGYILNRIGELGDRFRGIVYDPAWCQQIAEDIEDAGVVPIEFSQAPSFMAPAVAGAFDAITKQVLVHDGDLEFARQVNGAARQQQRNGFTLSKGRSRGKIDGAVALCMALEGLARLEKPVDAVNTVW